MGRPKSIINPELVAQAEKELQGLTNGKLAVRLQAIKSCGNNPIQKVAEIIGVGRQALWSWIRDFKEHGIDGLQDSQRGHRASKLSAEQWGMVAKWLKEGTDSSGAFKHWTLESLKHEIYKQFVIALGTTALWRQVHKLGFRQKTPRPVHAKADKVKQDQFKKKDKRHH